MNIDIDNITLINFIDLPNDDHLEILAWRNHEHVRQWMYNNNTISESNHRNFILNLNHNKENIYFLVKYKEQKLGVIYFNRIDYINSYADFGLYANPFEKIAGIGRILEEICIKYAFNTLKLNKLKLEVFSDNERAFNLYKKYKFQETNRKIVNEREVICMELNK